MKIGMNMPPMTFAAKGDDQGEGRPVSNNTDDYQPDKAHLARVKEINKKFRERYPDKNPRGL